MNITHSDPNEIAKFSRMAEEWWNPQGPLRTLHDINPTRFAYIQQRTHLNKKIILDAGCGAGLFAEKMAEAGGFVTGIDLSDEALKAAEHHQQNHLTKVTYKNITLEALANEQPNTFNVITCLEMLEHVLQPSAIIQACSTLAAPGADLFFSTLNRTPLSYFGAIVAAEYIFKLLPRGTHDYHQFIQPAELDQWIRQAGLTPVDIIGLNYQPFTKKCSLSKNVSINYIMHAKKI